MLVAGKQQWVDDLADLTSEQFDATFKTNVYSVFWMVQEALPHLPAGATIVTTSSIQAYSPAPVWSTTPPPRPPSTPSPGPGPAAGPQGHPGQRGRPRPVLDPAAGLRRPAAENLPEFGKETPLGRAGQPAELAGAYVYLASAESGYTVGETLNVNGGMPTREHGPRRRPAQLRWGATGPGPVDERDDDGYADLRSYAAIGDGRTLALVARDGSIDWLPLPAIDAPPVFAALLDADHGGCIELRPVEEFTTEREYVPGTNVLTTTFRTASGSVRVTDALNTGVAGRLPWSELARRIEGLSGTVQLRAAVRPGTCFGTASPWIQETVHGAVLRDDGLTMAVRTLGEDRVVTGEQRIDVEYTATPGSRALLGLVATEREPLFLPEPALVDAGIDRTIRKWEAWGEEFRWQGDFDRSVRRAAHWR